MEFAVQGIGTRIKDRRKKLGLSQRALGDLVGVGADAVSKHERGAMGVGSETLMAYAQALETTAEHLAGDTSEPRQAKLATVPSLRAVPSAQAIPMPLARLLNDGRCNPITDEEMAHMTRHLAEGNSKEIADLEIHLLGHRAERDRTPAALDRFRAAALRAHKEDRMRRVTDSHPPPAATKKRAKPELTR